MQNNGIYYRSISIVYNKRLGPVKLVSLTIGYSREASRTILALASKASPVKADRL